MTQIAIVQPAAPRIPPAGPPVNGEKQQFSTHFEKAISSKKDQLSTREDQPSTRENLSSNQSQKPNIEEEPTADIAGQDIATETTSPSDSDEDMGLQDFVDALFTQKIPADTTFSPLSSSNAAVIGNQPGEGMEATPTLTGNLPNEVKEATLTLTGSLPNEGKGAPLPFAGILTQELSMSSSQPLTESSAFTHNPTESAIPIAQQMGQKPATDALLAQLQQIISNSDEKGTVTIAKVDNTPAATINDGRGAQVTLPQPVTINPGQNHIAISSQYSEVNTEAPLFAVSEGFKLPTEKSDQQLTSLRQNTQQQYYEAKINLQSTGQEDSMPQDNSQQRGEPGASAASPVAAQNASAAPIIGEQTNTFAQSLTAVQDSPSLPASEPGKTVTLPSGLLVREEDVIRQVLERFQISRRQLDTQLNIKLHPAELGELKIDLTVKEGSIRANVVAQSQHAQEIIEKNMVKLRTVLETNGFTIDTITVTSKFDSTDDANLFDRQLFSQSDYTPRSNNRRNNSDSGFRFEETLLPTQPGSTGVNVKI